MRTAHNSPGTVISLSTVTGGVTLTNPTIGEVTLTLPAAITGAVAAGTYRHTLARTDSGGEAVLSEGSFQMKANSVLPV